MRVQLTKQSALAVAALLEWYCTGSHIVYIVNPALAHAAWQELLNQLPPESLAGDAADGSVGQGDRERPPRPLFDFEDSSANLRAMDAQLALEHSTEVLRFVHSHGHGTRELRHREDVKCDAFMCLPERNPRHYRFVLSPQDDAADISRIIEDESRSVQQAALLAEHLQEDVANALTRAALRLSHAVELARLGLYNDALESSKRAASESDRALSILPTLANHVAPAPDQCRGDSGLSPDWCVTHQRSVWLCVGGKR